MNKNFEEAYKAEVQQNIPDLWNRIESGLPEKKVKKKNPYAWIKWASLAAAGLLVVIMIPAVVGLGVLGITSSDTASAESVTNEIYITQDAVMEEAADMETADGAPAMDYDYADVTFEESENIVVEETAQEEGFAESEKETPMEDVENESVSGSATPLNLYGEMLVEGIPATVTGVISNFDRDYYNVSLSFEGDALELTDELFGENECYDNGMLAVRVYYDVTLQPQPGEKYIVTIYEVVKAAWGEEVTYVPCAAELSVEPYKQY